MAKKDWTPIDIEIIGLENPTDKTKDDERSKKRSKLAYLMDMYDKENSCESTKTLYTKYNIKSRKELTDSQLDSEIESYSAAVAYNQQ